LQRHIGKTEQLLAILQINFCFENSFDSEGLGWGEPNSHISIQIFLIDRGKKSSGFCRFTKVYAILLEFPELVLDRFLSNFAR